MKCPHCELINPSTAQRCDCGYDFVHGMPMEREPISMADRTWLWAARCSALIFFSITLIAAFRAHGSIRPIDWWLTAAWWLLSLGQLWLLFRRGKNALAFGLGMGAAMAPSPIALVPVMACIGLIAGSPLADALGAYVLVVLGLSVLGYFSTQPWLFWPGCISLLTLAVSAVVVFTKMRDEGERGRRLRLAFGAGIFCTLVVCCALWIFLVVNVQIPCLR
jgi:hypothetical protein